MSATDPEAAMSASSADDADPTEQTTQFAPIEADASPASAAPIAPEVKPRRLERERRGVQEIDIWTFGPPFEELETPLSSPARSVAPFHQPLVRVPVGFQPAADVGTDLVFDAFKFYIEQTPHGVMQIHGYPYDATGSTFIVEMHDAVWRAAGFGELAPAVLPPGASDDASIARI